jgi:elongation factor Ts
MAEISAQMVKELRETSGAGMMDCKAALVENKGDMAAAQDWLRKKGLSKAAKKAGRVAAEGLIGISVRGAKGIVVEVNSETDFVARNDLFQGLVKMIADVAQSAGTDVEKIKAAKAGSITIDEAIKDTIAKIGENMTLRRAAELSVGKGAIGSYVHSSVSWSGWSRLARPTNWWRSGAWSRCISRRPIRRRLMQQVSIRPWCSGKRTCWPTNSVSRASLLT